VRRINAEMMETRVQSFLPRFRSKKAAESVSLKNFVPGTEMPY